MGRITVCGSVNMDVIVQAPRFPMPGETVSGGTLRLLPGGKGANQAVAAARAGAPVRFAGAVGQDAFGDDLAAFLRAEGIETGALQRLDAPTGVATITVAGGENAIVVAPGANHRLEPDMLPVDHGAGDIVLVQLEIPAAAVEAALEGASRAGARSILNAAPPVPSARDAAGRADLLVVNQTELDYLAGDRVPDVRIAAAAAPLAPTTIVTLGAQGVVVVSEGRDQRLDARAVEAVDTTGAGDCFCGYLAATLLSGADLATAVRRAIVASSICVTRHGAGPSMPGLAEVLAAEGT